jgi:hypothetical protein
MNHLPEIFVIATGLWLVAFPVVIVFARRRAEAFLQGFAGSARAHYLEQGIRLIAGTAFVLFAPEMRFSLAFQYFGWILVLTTLGLLLLPWRWHQRFAGWAVPWAIRHLKLYALGSFLFGAFILFAYAAG